MLALSCPKAGTLGSIKPLAIAISFQIKSYLFTLE